MTFIRLASKKEVLCGTRFPCWHPAQLCTLLHDRLDVFCSYLASHFSGLSATIGSPEIFNACFQSVQEAHGFNKLSLSIHIVTLIAEKGLPAWTTAKCCRVAGSCILSACFSHVSDHFLTMFHWRPVVNSRSVLIIIGKLSAS